jgi:histone H3/H4
MNVVFLAWLWNAKSHKRKKSKRTRKKMVLVESIPLPPGYVAPRIVMKPKPRPKQLPSGKKARPELAAAARKARETGRPIPTNVPHRRTPRLTPALRNIRALQHSTDLQLRRLPFQRLVREITLQFERPSESFRFQKNALVALQESAEMYLTSLFDDANICAKHAKRVTLLVKDIKLTRQLRGQLRGENEFAANTRVANYFDVPHIL